MDYFAILRQRRSTRRFAGGQVSQDDVSEILLAANGAPVGSNLYRDIHLTVVQNRELLGKLAEAAVKRAEDTKRMKQILGETTLDEDSANPVKIADPFYGAPTVIFVSHRIQDIQPGIEYANVACVTLAMHLAATGLGLGSVFMWHALESMREIPDLDHTHLLNLPEGFAPLLGIALGHPAKPLGNRELKPDKLGVNYL